MDNPLWVVAVAAAFAGTAPKRHLSSPSILQERRKVAIAIADGWDRECKRFDRVQFIKLCGVS